MEKNNETREAQEQPDLVTDTRKNVSDLVKADRPKDRGLWTMLPEEWATYARQKNIY